MGPLEDVFRNRTSRNTKGTIDSEWEHTLLFRDLDRLVEQGVVEEVDCPFYVESDNRDRRCFRDLLTQEMYVYVGSWERGSPQFHKVEG